MGDHEIVEMRHPARPPRRGPRRATVGLLDAGRRGVRHRPPPADPQLAARRASACSACRPIVLLRDLGPACPGDKLDAHTSGSRACASSATSSARPIQASDIEIGDLVNAEPEALFAVDEDGEPLIEGVDAPDRQVQGRGRSWSGWSPTTSPPARAARTGRVDGILCYSKICTHVGCPISLYERTTHHLLCPCHQSTFDLADNGKVIFGPAARPLPQLPHRWTTRATWWRRATSPNPSGPSFWERDSR